MSELPTFDLSQMSFKNDEELNAAEAATGSRDSKFFDPGQYDLRIAAVNFTGMSQKDTTWGKLQFELAGTGEKMMKDTILVPYRDIRYGTNATLLPFKKMKSFLSALGYDVKVETLQETLKAAFSKPERLIGKHVKADIGYDRAYIKYAGKATDGQGSVYEIVQKDKNVVVDNSGNPLRFPSRDAAESFATARSIPIQRFTNILQYQKSSVQTDDVPW